MSCSMSFLSPRRGRGPERDAGKLESPTSICCVDARRQDDDVMRGCWVTHEDEVKAGLGRFTEEVEAICTVCVF